MEFVQTEHLIDASLYVRHLPSFRALLPQGAYSFASDPDHYNFYGTRCVKDLELERIHGFDDRELGFTLVFRGNKWKHKEDLQIVYRDVVSVSISVDGEHPLGTKRLGSVILDEVLPETMGCHHELAFTGGLVLVVCADLVATWRSSAVAEE